MTATFYLILSVCISSLSIISMSYVYGEFDGKLRNNLQINISIHLFDQGWVTVYAVDTSGNKLSIYSPSMKGDKRKLIFNFNGQNVTVLRQGEGTTKSQKTYLIKLHFANNDLYYGSDSDYVPSPVLSNIFAGNYTKSEELSDFPAARNFTLNEEVTVVWVGHIGSLLENRKKESEYKSMGCLNSFIVNGKSIHFTENGEYFSYPCTRKVNERERGHDKSKSFHILQCYKRNGMNTKRYCWANLLVTSGTKRSYAIKDTSLASVTMTLAWKQDLSRTQCLLEILSKNGSLILFYTDKNDQVVMCSGIYGSLNCTRRIWDKISLNTIYVLLIKSEFPNLTVKISNNSQINKFIDEITIHPNWINIGFSSKLNVCDAFHGEIDFRHDKSQFTIVKSEINTTTIQFKDSRTQPIYPKISSLGSRTQQDDIMITQSIDPKVQQAINLNKQSMHVTQPSNSKGQKDYQNNRSIGSRTQNPILSKKQPIDIITQSVYSSSTQIYLSKPSVDFKTQLINIRITQPSYSRIQIIPIKKSIDARMQPSTNSNQQSIDIFTRPIYSRIKQINHKTQSFNSNTQLTDIKIIQPTHSSLQPLNNLKKQPNKLTHPIQASKKIYGTTKSINILLHSINKMLETNQYSVESFYKIYLGRIILSLIIITFLLMMFGVVILISVRRYRRIRRVARSLSNIYDEISLTKFPPLPELPDEYLKEDVYDCIP